MLKKYRRKYITKVKISYFLDTLSSSAVDYSSSLIINGFWRSGTTWIQECVANHLKAKTVFEPLCPYANSYRVEEHRRSHPQGMPSEHGFMPLFSDLDKGIIDRCLQSRVPGGWIRGHRRTLSESLRRRVAVKFTRAHFLLPVLCDYYSIPIIHVWRDPRAVVASVLRTEWLDWLQHIPVSALLLDKDPRKDFFSTRRHYLEEVGARSVAKRIATYWSATERYVVTSTHDRKDVALVNYENTVRDSGSDLAHILHCFGLDPKRSFTVLEESSPTTDRSVSSVEDRLTSWKKELTDDQISDINSVVSFFSLEDRLLD